MWFVFALLSAVFAALTSILAKVGIDGVNSNLATAIRTMVVLAMAWGMVFVTNTQGGLTDISKKSWLFLILSGLATGASWLCYYRALQIGEASKVVPIDKLSVVITLVLAFVFLHERFTPKSLIGCLLIGAGTLLMVVISDKNGRRPAECSAGRRFSVLGAHVVSAFLCVSSFTMAKPRNSTMPTICTGASGSPSSSTDTSTDTMGSM